MNPLTLLGDSLKAIASPQRLTYAPQVSSGYTTPEFWGAAGPGAKRDYTALVGDPLQNYVIAAAVNAIALALPDAPPFLEQLQDGVWKRVDDHPVLDFLRQPHEDLDDADVWSLTSVYRVTRGEAFWVIQLNSLGLPAEAVPTDPRRVRVIGTREQLISSYEVTTEDGQTLLFPKEQILHFRHLPAPHNLRRGWTPLSTGNRQLVGSNSASTYHTALLLNGAVSSWLISMKDASQGTVSPEQFQTFIDAMRRKYAGTTESMGGIDGLSIPLEIQRMAYSPDEMAIDKLIDYYEQTLCALTGVSKKILDLGADATYLNLREAINDFWERRLVPMRNKDARALTNQLLPLFGLDKTGWRLRFDFSNVPALQENQDALFTRWRDLYKAGGCDLFTLQTKIGLPDIPQQYKERFAGQKPNNEDGQTQAVKYNRNHDLLGEFASGSGVFHAPDDGGSNIGGSPPTSSPKIPTRENEPQFTGNLKLTGHDSPAVKAACHTLFGRELTEREWKAISGAPDHHDVRIKMSGPSIEIRMDKGHLFKKPVISKIHPIELSTQTNEGTGGAELEMESMYKAPGATIPKDLAPRMLVGIFKTCDALGIKSVFGNAAGSAQESREVEKRNQERLKKLNEERLEKGLPKLTELDDPEMPDIGYSRWPQLGFDAPLSTDILKKLPSEYQGSRRVSDLIVKGGLKWWINNGHGDGMRFNLRPKSRSRRTFETYLKNKGIS